MPVYEIILALGNIKEFVYTDMVISLTVQYSTQYKLTAIFYLNLTQNISKTL